MMNLWGLCSDVDSVCLCLFQAGGLYIRNELKINCSAFVNCDKYTLRHDSVVC